MGEIRKVEDKICGFGGLCLFVIFLLIVSIFPTEAALKKTFDEDGTRIM